MQQPSTAVIHFYRAAVGHADFWRKRLDTTTNWAVVTNAGILTFVFRDAQTPHFLLLMLLMVDLFFLYMEARRYQIYDIWHHRIQVMHQYVFAPALKARSEWPDDRDTSRRELVWLGEDLGHTVPRVGVVDAVGYRLRRSYIFILIITLTGWGLKLYIHPQPVESWGEWVARAAVGPLSGAAVMIAIGTIFLLALWLAFRAPSEALIGWSKRPSPLRWFLSLRWLYLSPEVDELGAPGLGSDHAYFDDSSEFLGGRG